MYVYTYVCMYVCMYVYTYVCMHVCIYVCMYACMYIRTPNTSRLIYHSSNANYYELNTNLEIARRYIRRLVGLIMEENLVPIGAPALNLHSNGFSTALNLGAVTLFALVRYHLALAPAFGAVCLHLLDKPGGDLLSHHSYS